MFRFQDWNSGKNTEVIYSPNNDIHPGRIRSTIYTVSDKFQRSLEFSSESVMKLPSVEHHSTNTENTQRNQEEEHQEFIEVRHKMLPTSSGSRNGVFVLNLVRLQSLL